MLYCRKIQLRLITVAGGIFLCFFTAIGQRPLPAGYGSASGNFVRTWTAMFPDQSLSDLETQPVSNVHLSTLYLDGLGRPLQTVDKQMTPSAKDLVTTHVYDPLGREAINYLPYSVTTASGTDAVNDGNFKLNAFAEDISFNQGQYPGQTYYYDSTYFEPSPMSRVLTNYAPGNSWVGQDKGNGFGYFINSAQDNVYTKPYPLS